MRQISYSLYILIPNKNIENTSNCLHVLNCQAKFPTKGVGEGWGGGGVEAGAYAQKCVGVTNGSPHGLV